MRPLCSFLINVCLWDSPASRNKENVAKEQQQQKKCNVQNAGEKNKTKQNNGQQSFHVGYTCCVKTMVKVRGGSHCLHVVTLDEVCLKKTKKTIVNNKISDKISDDNQTNTPPTKHRLAHSHACLHCLQWELRALVIHQVMLPLPNTQHWLFNVSQSHKSSSHWRVPIRWFG